MIKLDQIRALHIELTTKCNARCPMCMRNYRGYDFNGGYPLTELSLDNIRTIFTPEFLKQIYSINFNGNLGDFSLASDAAEIVDYFLTNSTARIQIETNGSTRNNAWWAQLAHPRITILFALDGLSDTHELYRQDTSWAKVISNATALIKAGGNAVWKFISFDHNQHQLEPCREMSQTLGFINFVIYDQSRNSGPVFNRKGEFSHWLGKPRDSIPELSSMIENHITWFDYKKTDQITDNKIINCYHIQRKELYLAADGSVYPCCFLGFYPGSMSHTGNSQLVDIVKNNNALEYTLAECMEWFDSVEASWSQPSIAAGRLYSCVSTCGQ